MIKSVENLGIGDTFKIGNTPVIVIENIKGHRDTNNNIMSLLTRYKDSGRDVKLMLVAPKIFLVELLEA